MFNNRSRPTDGLIFARTGTETGDGGSGHLLGSCNNMNINYPLGSKAQGVEFVIH